MKILPTITTLAIALVGIVNPAVCAPRTIVDHFRAYVKLEILTHSSNGVPKIGYREFRNVRYKVVRDDGSNGNKRWIYVNGKLIKTIEQYQNDGVWYTLINGEKVKLIVK